VRVIERLYRAKMTELVLCASGPAVAFDRERVKGSERTNPLPQEYGSRVYEFHSRWNHCPDDDYIRLRIIVDIVNELRGYKISRVHKAEYGTLELKVAVARDRRSEGSVSHAYGIDIRTVREYRQEIRERVMAALDKGDRSIRAIAAEFGLSHGFVGNMRAVA